MTTQAPDLQLRILIADDEDLFLKPTAEILRAHGYHCDCVHRAEEAAEQLGRAAYDLLIMDINMPGNHNLEFLRQHSHSSHFLPIVVVTGYPTVQSAVESFRLTVMDYMVKPVSVPDLVQVVASAIEKGRAFRAMRAARRDFSTWLEQMQDMESALLARESADAADPSHAGSLDWYLGETVRQFAYLSLSLVSTIRTLKDSYRGSQTDICSLMHCPRLAMYQQAVRETIDVLVRTKNSFKSKELGDLRKTLEALPDRLL
jgi:CheY-like chemotaxis protein